MLNCRLSSLALLAATLVLSACGAKNATGMSDEETIECLTAGAWKASSGAKSILRSDGVWETTYSGQTTFSYSSGTWSLEGSVLTSTVTKLGSSDTSLDDAKKTAKEPTAENSYQSRGYVVCSGNKLAVKAYEGGDPGSLVGEWKQLTFEQYLKKDGEYRLSKVESGTIHLKDDGKGEVKESKTVHHSGGEWLSSPSESNETTTLCSWEKTDTKIKIKGAKGTCTGSETEKEIETIVVGDVIGTSISTRE